MDSSIVGTSLRCRGAVVTTWRFGFINTERTVPAFNNNYDCSSTYYYYYSPGAYAGAVGRLHCGVDAMVGNDY
jgi:hypothetical protein